MASWTAEFGVAWRGVAWRGVAWRGAVGSSSMSVVAPSTLWDGSKNVSVQSHFLQDFVRTRAASYSEYDADCQGLLSAKHSEQVLANF
ncbi:MAG: hypothetical protein EON54_12285 [Alcaligenaceae bacterium]|nr:MAG: hypothetical protein EON54_12285 [Alcaligenaceae bacterium]